MTQPLPSSPPHPTGRCFGRTRPLRPGRRLAIDDRLPERAIAVPGRDDELDPAALFDPPLDDVWLEIGFGGGEHLLGRARADPGVGFVGCEPYVPGVASLLADADAVSLQRIRVFQHDARLLLPRLRPASLGRVFVLFADPWPKRRHWRRRILQADTLAWMARALRPEGELLFVSDHADYVRWTLALALDRHDLAWLAGRPNDWRDPPQGWVATRYQRKAEARGARSYYLRFCRR